MSDKNRRLSDDPMIIAKYARHRNVDPFPDIPPALLNSADIHSYVNATGMIHPFEEKALKSASYAAKIAGECRYWDEKNKKFETVLLEIKGDKLILKPNSIAFVGIDPTFRLPDYIALRFNLKISNVYRGLLLGTGPLIDPGFEGKISIPLHNLTSNEYVFSYGESLIWIEFTKTSPIPKAKKISASEEEELKKLRCYEFTPFPADKKEKELDYYLTKALEKTSYTEIVSSIPSAMLEAKKSAETARKNVQVIRNLGALAALGVVIGVGALVYNSWTLQRDYFEQATVKIDQIDQAHKTEIMESNKNLMKIIEENDKRISLLEFKIKTLTSNNGKQEASQPLSEQKVQK
jgi:deoxycytidine triphosphate deaminase